MKNLLIIAVFAVGCGAPFVGVEETEPEVVFLEYGTYEAPPPEDVCVDVKEQHHRGEPDAGTRRPK